MLRMLACLTLSLLVGPSLVSRTAFAAEPVTLSFAAVELTAKDVGEGWQVWNEPGDVHGAISYRERNTALAIDAQDVVWVGTSLGRLFRREREVWTTTHLPDHVQITGIAVDGNTVWLSTSDGIRRLVRNESTWQLTEYRQYYSGHPSFVSGAYIPGEDARRLWGYVDDIFMPRSEPRSYAPHVISTEHGLFSHAQGYGVWHHFWPHFTGANSDWLDLRELLPGRRPTCMTEDQAGNLWIGSEGDGIVRVNAAARSLSQRGADNNTVDPTAFTRFSAAEVRIPFRRVVQITPALDGGVWCVFDGPEKEKYVGRYHQDRWNVVELPRLKRHTYQGQMIVKTDWWGAEPQSIIDLTAHKALIGVENYKHRVSVVELDWSTRQFRDVTAFEFPVRQFERMANGQLWARSDWALWNQSHNGVADNRLPQKAAP